MAQKSILELDLLSIARHRKHLSIATLCIIVALIAYMIWLFNTPNMPIVPLAISQILIGLLAIWVVVAGILLQVAMGVGVVTIVFTAFAAFFLPWLVGLALVSQATTILKLAGAKTGFFGLSTTEREKITPGHCRGCGYSREGLELLQECPEYQRVPQVI